LQDKSIGHWRFSCVMSFPWRPILSGDSSSLFHVRFVRCNELLTLVLVEVS
jgi:hypothetical protein